MTSRKSTGIITYLKSFFNERFFDTSGCHSYLNRWLNWPTMFAVAVIYWLMVMLTEHGAAVTPDSAGYVRSWEVYAGGTLDLVRTPGYPLLIGLFKMVFGYAWEYVLVLFQEVLFLWSVVLFRDMCRLLVPSRKLGIILTLTYLLTPVCLLYHYANYLNNDSIAYSLIVVLLHSAVSGIVNRRLTIRSSLFMMSVVAICIAVRPIYIYLLPCMGVFWLWNFADRRLSAKASCAGLCLTIFVTVGVLFYQKQIEQIYGYKGITSVSYCNNYFFVREYGLLNPEFAPTAELRYKLDSIAAEPFDKYWRIWKEISTLKENDPHFVEMNEVVTRSIVSRPDKTASALLNRAVKAASFPFVECGMGRISQKVLKIFVPRLSLFYLFLAIDFGVLIWLWRKRGFDGALWFLWMFAVVTHLTAVMGAQYEWGRLSYQAYPAVLLLGGNVFTIVLHRLKRQSIC